jgi:16S rRNA (cytidine1402-2'-O)-methyltransferase
VFIGFLPAKAVARHKALTELASSPVTVVAYESPHRILDALRDMDEILGSRPIVLARELTKVHEEFLRGTPGEIRQQLSKRDSIKGEITIVIARSETKDAIEDPLAEIIRLEREDGLDRMGAIKAVAKRLGLPKREVYRLAAAQDSNRQNKNRH